MNIRDLITLSDTNKYIVVGKVDYENITYYYIADINKNDNFKFCYIDDDELVEINDSNLIQKLIPLFGMQAVKEINKYMKDND